MKKKKFRHIHRYAYIDIGNRPWIYKSLFDILNEPTKEAGYRKKVHIINDSRQGKSPWQILRMLRARCGKSAVKQKSILKKNPDRGITTRSQIPDECIKRVPFWKK